MNTTSLAETVINGRKLSDYAPSADFPRHSHGTHVLAGYVIRQTERDGEYLWHDEAKTACGEDVAVVEGSTNYADALEIKHTYRTGTSYAVIDSLYTCGCRS